MDIASYVQNVKYALPQLKTDHNQIVSRLPNTPHYNAIIKEIEDAANNHLDGEMAKLRRKAEQLDAEYCEMARFMEMFMNWCVKSIALSKGGIKAQVRLRIEQETQVWQQSTELALQENEALRDKVARCEQFVGELKRVKKLDRMKILVDKFSLTA